MSLEHVKQTTKLSFLSLLVMSALLFGLVVFGSYRQSANNKWTRAHVAQIEALADFSKTFDAALQNTRTVFDDASAERGQVFQSSWDDIRRSLSAVSAAGGAHSEFQTHFEDLNRAVESLANLQISQLASGAGDDAFYNEQNKAINKVQSVLMDWQLGNAAIYETAQTQNYESLSSFSVVLIVGFSFLLAMLVAVMVFVARKFSDLGDNLAQASHESKRNHLMLENAVSGVISIDERGLIKSFNPAAEGLFQYDASEVLGRNVSILMPENHAVSHDNYLQSYMTTGVAEIIGIGRELQGRRKDGSLFPMELGVAEMPLDGGRMFIGTVTDISSRKEAQEEAFKAKVLAERANKAKSEFLSSMSHELRTPLNAILGFGQILGDDDEDPLSEDQKQAVAHILKAGDHLIRLITDVLDMAKIETGKLTISMEDVDPQDIVGGCLSMSRAMAMKRGIKIEDRVSTSTLPKIRVDATRFKQVMLNLISNAIKYNKPKGDIIVESEQRFDGHLRIIVSDTGAGIPAALQDKLFLPFERLGREGSQIEGSGIGLSITKELVVLMGGKVGFESEEGVGSMFWVEFPMSKDSDQLEDTPDSGTDEGEVHSFIKKRVAGHQGASKRLLYVEDNPANTLLMEAIIKNTPNYALTTVTSAEDGIALLNQSPEGTFDLILMDINLPGMDGVEASRLIKANEKTCSIPIIAVSAAAMPSDLERASMAHMEEYLTKPLNVKNTIEVFDRTLAMIH